MKKLFFFLVVANLLVFLGARFVAPPLPEEPDMRSGGNIRFLNPGELEAYRASGGGRDTGESEDTEKPATVVEDPEVFRAKLMAALELGEDACLALGPIDSRDGAATLAEELAQQNMAGSVRDESHTEVQNYLVVIPTRSSHEASTMVKQLRDAGQKDVWWLTSGNHKDEVSVGIFRSRDNAETRRKEVEALNFNAEIVPREVERKTYWIDLRAEPSRRVTVELIEKLRELHENLSAEQKRCTRSAL